MMTAVSFTVSPVEAPASADAFSSVFAAPVSAAPAFASVLPVVLVLPQPASIPAVIAAESISAINFFFILFPPIFI